MSYLQTKTISHARKVCSLYKRAARNLESYCFHRGNFRYQVTLLRARFDANKDIKDLRVAKQLYEEGERELFENQHPLPKKFPHSPGGIAYGREVTPPDWVLDYWDPIEKAAYPKYFALREKRKKEYIEMWNKKYGAPNPADD